MKMLSLIIVLFSLFLIVSCKTIPAPDPVKALLLNMDDSTKLQITKIVSDSMGGKSVKIAESEFSTDNKMTITTNTQDQLEGNPVSGLVIDMPQHYQLMMRGNACYLVHEETATEYALEDVACKAM